MPSVLGALLGLMSVERVRRRSSLNSQHVGLDSTRRDTVDGDTTLAKVSSKGLDHANDGHLGSVVEDVVPDTEETGGNRGHEDEAAVVLEMLPRGLADEELGASVEVEDVVVLLLCDLLGLVPGLGAAVAHDNVDLAKVLLGVLEEPLDLGGLADIGLDADGLGTAAAGLDLLDDLVCRGLAALVVDDDAAATLAEFNGTSTTNTAASTSDQSDLAVKGRRGDGNNSLRHVCGLLVDYIWIFFLEIEKWDIRRKVRIQ